MNVKLLVHHVSSRLYTVTVTYMLLNPLRYNPMSLLKEHDVVAFPSLIRKPIFENFSPVDILLTQKKTTLRETDMLNFLRHIIYGFFLDSFPQLYNTLIYNL